MVSKDGIHTLRIASYFSQATCSSVDQAVKITVPFREEDEQVVLDGSSSHGELHSFVICGLHASELVGLDCKDSYLPHRVAMQFGMDQDLPGEPYRSDFTFKNIRFFVPSRTFVAGAWFCIGA
ncbi:PROTEIN MAIN-LIKE 2 [Salix purpurea]|uniref:PROTEIN MAIN-LIKE 2 n=1 Tax=Salix purpurea TaxID=77065 RepID=A0A9Q1A0N0_SALPP|nr:PROTEIN MAIN-LIKE 2 [Salix purpurea]